MNLGPVILHRWLFNHREHNPCLVQPRPQLSLAPGIWRKNSETPESTPHPHQALPTLTSDAVPGGAREPGQQQQEQQVDQGECVDPEQAGCGGDGTVIRATRRVRTASPTPWPLPRASPPRVRCLSPQEAAHLPPRVSNHAQRRTGHCPGSPESDLRRALFAPSRGLSCCTCQDSPCRAAPPTPPPPLPRVDTEVMTTSPLVFSPL